MALHLEGVCPLIQVFDMPTSIAFYCEALGFEMVETSHPGETFDWAWLRHNDAELMLNTAYESQARPAAPDAARVDAHRDTALFFGCRDVDGAYDHLRQQGLDVEPPVVTPYGMKQLYLRDPDGYNLCFQWQANGPPPTAPS